MTASSNTTKTRRKPRRRAAAPAQATAAKAATKRRRAAAPAQATEAKTSKLDLIVGQLIRPEGASLAELVAATGWQAHSVRGALAGTLKKKGHAISSAKVDGERRYRIGAPA